jgi:hypothetical protein
VNIELNYWSECINCKMAFAVYNKIHSLLQEEIQRNSTAKKYGQVLIGGNLLKRE